MSANNKTVLDATNGSPSAGRWIYRTAEGNIGPIPTEEFLVLVQNGTILPQTLVRLSDSKQWMPASDIDGLEFCATSAAPITSPETDSLTKEQRVAHNRAMQQLFAECVGRQRSSIPKTHRVPVRAPAVRMELPFKQFFGSIVSYISDQGSSALESSTSLAGQVRSFVTRSIRSRVVWLSLVLLILVALMNPTFPRFWATHRQIYTALQTTLTELKELRSKDADDATWQEFRQRYDDNVLSHVPALMNATGETQIAPSLLTVARYLMPALIDDRGGKDLKTQKRVESFLAKVGETLDRPIATQINFTSLIITVDVLIAIAALMYFGRGWFSRGLAEG